MSGWQKGLALSMLILSLSKVGMSEAAHLDTYRTMRVFLSKTVKGPGAMSFFSVLTSPFLVMF